MTDKSKVEWRPIVIRVAAVLAIAALIIIAVIFVASSALYETKRPVLERHGSQVVSEPPGQTENIRAVRLIDRNFRTAWRSRKDDAPPFVFVFVMATDSKIDRLGFRNSRNEEKIPGISVREVEVEFSMDGPDTGYYRAGLYSLEKGDEPQNFEIPRSSAKWVRLTIHSNHGHPNYTELGMFEAWGNLNFHTPLLISYFIWIVGAAVFLAAFGWHQHLARRAGMRLCDALSLTTFTNPAKVGAALIAAGVLASAAGESARVPVLAAMGTIGGVLALFVYLKSAKSSDQTAGNMDG